MLIVTRRNYVSQRDMDHTYTHIHTHTPVLSCINIYYHRRGMKVKLSSTYQVMSTWGHTHTHTLLQWLVLYEVDQKNFLFKLFCLSNKIIFFSSFVPLFS